MYLQHMYLDVVVMFFKVEIFHWLVHLNAYSPLKKSTRGPYGVLITKYSRVRFNAMRDISNQPPPRFVYFAVRTSIRVF